MANEYAYTTAQCDVVDKRALQSYRDKRRLWLSWIDTDEHHAIWNVLCSMVWTDVSFQVLTNFATADESNGLNNSLLAEALLDGHVATQVLTIRRLVDSRNDVISLRRLVKDIRSSFDLFTRENYVCFDGMPYDHEAVQNNEMMENLRLGNGPFWGAKSGPTAHGPSQLAHKQFDQLTGILPEQRRRDDRLPRSILTTIEKWLEESGADELAKWSHIYLAHAGGPDARQRDADLKVTSTKIAGAIKALTRVTEAVSAYVLLASSRSSASLMPVAQFNPFEKLDRPVMAVGGEKDAYVVWHRLGDERNRYLDGVDAELVKHVKAASK